MSLLNWKKSRVLVTGGHGFLGTHLIEALRARGCTEPIVPKRTECDFRDPVEVRRLFEGSPFDLVIHLAASVGGIGANRKHPADFYFDNAAMGLNLLAESARKRAGKFILLGTICAYPKFTPVPFKEEDLWNGYPEETNAPYGIAKRSLVVAAEAFKSQYGLNYSAVFPTNLYGPSDDFDLDTSHVIPAIIRKCEEARVAGRPSITLWGSGKVSRDFLYVKDAVEAILRACETEAADGLTMNLGSEEEISIGALAEKIRELTGFEGEIMWDASMPDGQPRRCVSGDLARKILSFRPKYPLDAGLRETIQWYREHNRRTT